MKAVRGLPPRSFPTDWRSQSRVVLSMQRLPPGTVPTSNQLRCRPASKECVDSGRGATSRNKNRATSSRSTDSGRSAQWKQPGASTPNRFLSGWYVGSRKLDSPAYDDGCSAPNADSLAAAARRSWASLGFYTPGKDTMFFPGHSQLIPAGRTSSFRFTIRRHGQVEKDAAAWGILRQGSRKMSVVRLSHPTSDSRRATP